MSNRIGAFWSYARKDDPTPLAAAYEAIRSEVSSLIGWDFKIWRDRQDIATGIYWKDAIISGAHNARFLIAIITPRWIESEYCTEEYNIFLKAEQERALSNIIFPIMYIKCFHLNSRSHGKETHVLDLRNRQVRDWTDIREDLRQHGTEHPKVRAEVRSVAEEIADRVIETEKRIPRGTQSHAISSKFPTRKIIPQGAPTRPMGPARIEISSGGNYRVEADQIEVKIGTEFEQVEVSAGTNYVFPLDVSRALVQVDAFSCDVDPDSCFGLGGQSEIEGLRYKRLGEWEIQPKDKQMLRGDYFPGTPTCRLVNCELEVGAKARIVANAYDLAIDLSRLRSRLSKSSGALTPTKEKLLAIWLKEQICEKLGGSNVNVVLHEAKIVTKAQNESN